MEIITQTHGQEKLYYEMMLETQTTMVTQSESTIDCIRTLNCWTTTIITIVESDEFELLTGRKQLMSESVSLFAHLNGIYVFEEWSGNELMSPFKSLTVLNGFTSLGIPNEGHSAVFSCP
jgi:hypothetical protein